MSVNVTLGIGFFPDCKSGALIRQSFLSGSVGCCCLRASFPRRLLAQTSAVDVVTVPCEIGELMLTMSPVRAFRQREGITRTRDCRPIVWNRSTGASGPDVRGVGRHGKRRGKLVGRGRRRAPCLLDFHCGRSIRISPGPSHRPSSPCFSVPSLSFLGSALLCCQMSFRTASVLRDLELMFITARFISSQVLPPSR